MATEPLTSLLEVFSQISDPRDPRGIRHPFSGLLTLVFLALLAPRQRVCGHSPLGGASLGCVA